MKIAIMQPYFYPYMGYFQLIEQVDTIVIFDDVNYIKGGWINKNRILQQGQIFNITLPIQQASQNKKINQHQRINDEKTLVKIKKQIESAYLKAPNYSQVFPLVANLLAYNELNLARYLGHSLSEIANFLGFKTQFIYASELNIRGEWSNAEERIIQICKTLGGKEYFNLPGGKHLYHKQNFSKHQLQLEFISPQLRPYKQLNSKDFIPGLSVIDYLMNQ